MVQTKGDRVVVLDNGGHTCKAGFAGDADPKKCGAHGHTCLATASHRHARSELTCVPSLARAIGAGLPACAPPGLSRT
jgi:hypothetical protein